MSTKKKTIKRTSRTSKKSKKHPKHFLKVYWPYIPILAVVTFGTFIGGVNPNSQINQPATLAYSTEMSRSGLLSGTNSQRASNGLGALTINSKLNSSAQAKAQDMVNLDYWAHNSPNGNEPWVFFSAAGYSYEKAGENLAYGFSTSSDTIIGWMNSPSHKANILDTSYSEVGFGFVNSPNFIGTGQETVVVAHYGKPTSVPTPAPALAPPPAATVTPEAEPQALQATEVAEVEPVEEEPAKKSIEDVHNLPVTSDTPVPEDSESKNITRLQRLTQGGAPWSAIVLSTVVLAIVVVWLFKHALLVKKFLRNSEHFVAHHPILDLIVVVIAAVAVYLSQASGVII